MDVNMKLNSSGFSIVAAIVAICAIGALALILSGLNKKQMAIQRKVRTHFNVEDVSNSILRLLFDSQACTRTLGGTGALIKNGRPIPSIKNSNGGTIFNTVKTYGNDTVKLETITLDQANLANQSNSSVNLKVVFKKMGNAVQGYEKIVKKYPLALDLDSSLKLVSCYSNHQSIMNVVTNSSCNRVGGRLHPLTGKCIPAALAKASREFCEGMGATHNNPLCDMGNIRERAIQAACDSLNGNYRPASRKCVFPRSP